jgi:putative transposase
VTEKDSEGGRESQLARHSEVGRDSVEPWKKKGGRSNPAPGVHVYDASPTIAFLTVCTLQRLTGLATSEVHADLIGAWHKADSWWVGRYVIMPDHIHLFCAPHSTDVTIEHWITFWKRQFRRQSPSAPQFQSRGFHHRLRRAENYMEKWEYVRRNPVRAGLVREPDQWPFQGVLHDLVWWD